MPRCLAVLGACVKRGAPTGWAGRAARDHKHWARTRGQKPSQPGGGRGVPGQCIMRCRSTRNNGLHQLRRKSEPLDLLA